MRGRLGIFSIFLSIMCISGLLTASASAEDPGDFRKIIQDAKEKVFPAVVFLMPLTERFDYGKREKEQIAGSGVFISESGEAVTNWHVADKAVSIRCLLHDGKIGTAKVLGVDKDTDLALLQIEVPGVTKFPFAQLGKSAELKEGQFVMAMGAPWGLSRSVSLGIISCTTRFLSAEIGMYNLWIQTDASINPGNSGGPLVDTTGRVIGINTRATFFGGDMAFAIPSDTVKEITDQLRAHGHVPRSWLGVRLQPLKDFELNIFYEGDQGVLVASVDPGSPAEAAGLQVGDILLKVNDKPVLGVVREDIPAINNSIANLEQGKPTAIVLKRGDQTVNLNVTPRAKGAVEGEDFDCKEWNMTVKTINPFDTPELHFFRNNGVYVQGIRMPGNAAQSGLRDTDILLEINGKPIETLAELEDVYNALVKDTERVKKVSLKLLRNGLVLHTVLDYTKHYKE